LYLEVYPDVIFILNFIIDFIFLFILKKVNRKSSSILRLAGAAAAGAVSAVIIGIYPWMNEIIRFLFLNIAASILMVVIAFGRLKLTDLFKQVVVFYLITYFVGGFMNSIYYYTDIRLLLISLGNGLFFSNMSWKFILIVLFILTPAVVFFIWLFRWYRANSPQTFEVELVMEERRILTRGLMDTGNCLFDPIYKKPVMVIENALMEELLTPDFLREFMEAKSYLKENDFDKVRLNMENEHLLRLRFVPYQSVDKKGMMIGLILDKVLIHTGKETICNEKVTAAICDNCLSTKDNYHVILHTGLF
jgi:stage II sporulation protein GA (sporulation sigma-E factor processing peptidase)